MSEVRKYFAFFIFCDILNKSFYLFYVFYNLGAFMKISDKNIDNGRAFDWGLVSDEYAKFRDIYPRVFYEKIIQRGIGIKGQKILDLGTGTGVLPRNMFKYGAEWIGTDISENQILQAEKLSDESGMNIEFLVCPAEKINFPEASFDAVTACQCFWYFDFDKLAPVLTEILNKNGKFLLLYMAWLPFEDRIAGASEELVLKYNPDWSGAGETRHPIFIPDRLTEYFDVTYHEEYDIKIPFTKASWHGRMKACRGVGASLSSAELKNWEREHMNMLEKIAPEKFEVLHYCAMTELTVKN